MKMSKLITLSLVLLSFASHAQQHNKQGTGPGNNARSEEASLNKIQNFPDTRFNLSNSYDWDHKKVELPIKKFINAPYISGKAVVIFDYNGKTDDTEGTHVGDVSIGPSSVKYASWTGTVKFTVKPVVEGFRLNDNNVRVKQFFVQATYTNMVHAGTVGRLLEVDSAGNVTVH